MPNLWLSYQSLCASMAHWRGRNAQVEALAHADEGDAQGLEFGQCIYEMTERTAQTIELPNEHQVEPAPTGVGHEPVQLCY